MDLSPNEKQLESAIQSYDGISTSRVLEEIGACGWAQALKNVKRDYDDGDHHIFVSDNLNGNTETLEISARFSPNTYGATKSIVSVGGVTAARCDKK